MLIAQTRQILQVIICVSITLVIPFIASAQTTNIALVGNKVSTLIDTPENHARAFDVVKAALKKYKVSLTATSQAWSGSGLKNGTYDGFVDHYSLNEQKASFVYSEPYLILPLHVASRNKKAEGVNRLDKIYRTSLGIENRFANTSALRSERSVRWARSPDFLSNIKQLAGQRVDFLIADKFMLDEFNKMLLAQGKKLLFIASAPIYKVEMRLAIRAELPNAQNIINDFNQGLALLKTADNYEALISSADAKQTTLDEALFEDIVRKW